MTSTTMAPKIGKCLRLLASPADGEKLAAVAAMARTLKTGAMDFNDLADAVVVGLTRSKVPVSKPANAPVSDLDKAVWVRNAKLGSLKANQREFIISAINLLAYGCDLSKKQKRWLDAIYLAMGGNSD